MYSIEAINKQLHRLLSCRNEDQRGHCITTIRILHLSHDRLSTPAGTTRVSIHPIILGLNLVLNLLETREGGFSPLAPSASGPIVRTPSNDDQRPFVALAPPHAEPTSVATTPSTTSIITATASTSGIKEGQKTSSSTPIDPLASPVSIYSQRSLKPSNSPKSSEVVTSMPFVINSRSEDWDRGMFSFVILSSFTLVVPVYAAPWSTICPYPSESTLSNR